VFRRFLSLHDGSAAQPEAKKVTSKNSRLAPSGKVVAPSGSLGPVYCATYKTSLSFSLMLTRLGFTSNPKMPDITRAVSAWPTADSTSVGTSSGLIFLTQTKFIASRGSIFNENAFTRMCFAINSLLFSCLSIRRTYRVSQKKFSDYLYYTILYIKYQIL